MPIRLQDIPLTERPRERLHYIGAHALSHAELVACILGRGTRKASVVTIAHQVLERCGSLHGIAQASVEDLCAITGVGMAGATQLKAACEIGQRIQAPPPAGQLIDSGAAVYHAVRTRCRQAATEQVWLLLLDTRHRLVRIEHIASGALDACIVHPREIFHAAIHARAAAIVIAHNHPSGDVTPSDEDVALTEQLVQAGQTVGIPVLDHVIVGHDTYCSLIDSQRHAQE
jgi:DNA repair protein RadC